MTTTATAAGGDVRSLCRLPCRACAETFDVAEPGTLRLTMSGPHRTAGQWARAAILCPRCRDRFDGLLVELGLGMLLEGAS